MRMKTDLCSVLAHNELVEYQLARSRLAGSILNETNYLLGVAVRTKIPRRHSTSLDRIAHPHVVTVSSHVGLDKLGLARARLV